MYKIRCYDRYGNLHHEEYVEFLDEAKEIRTKWGLSIGLEPEPTIHHFAYYPTIWEQSENGWRRLEGY